MRNRHEDEGAPGGRQPQELRDGVLSLLTCPACGGALSQGEGCLICKGCRVAYPVTDGIPVLLASEGKPIG